MTKEKMNMSEVAQSTTPATEESDSLYGLDTERETKAQAISKSIRSKLRGLGQRLAGLNEPVKEIAREVVNARVLFGSLNGELPEYKRWYRDNVDAFIGEVVSGETDELDKSARSLIRGKLKYHIQQQLREVLREEHGRDKADAMLTAAGLDPQTPSERQSEANKKNKGDNGVNSDVSPSDTASDTASLFNETAAKKSPMVAVAQSMVAAAVLLRDRLNSDDGQKLAGGDRKAILAHCETVAGIVAEVTSAVSAEQVAA
jgi:hypothetical protein